MYPIWRIKETTSNDNMPIDNINKGSWYDKGVNVIIFLYIRMYIEILMHSQINEFFTYEWEKERNFANEKLWKV